MKETKPIKDIPTEDLIKLEPDKLYSTEELRSEIAVRLYRCNKELELQSLWRAFKKLT